MIEDNQILDNGAELNTSGVRVNDNDVTVRNNHLSNAGGRDVQTIAGKRAVIIDNVITACNSIVLGGGAFVFAPLQGQEHSNITHAGGYCP